MRMKYLIGPIVILFIFTAAFLKHKMVKVYSPNVNNGLIGFTLKNVTLERNLLHLHKSFKIHNNFHKVEKWLSAVGASVSVIDINQDGYQDIFFNDSSVENNHGLFINDQKGHFIEASKQFKIDKLNFPQPITRPLFFDCNNDGFPDMLLLSICPQLFINHDGKYFEDFTVQSGLNKMCSNVGYAANAFDYDKDGNLDLIWANYNSSDYINNRGDSNGILPDNFLDSKNTAKVFLMKGDGQCHFKDKSNLLPTQKFQGWFFDIGIQDIFKLGQQDIWISTDFGINHLLQYNSKNKNWDDKSFMVDKVGLSRNGMSYTASDINHNQNPSIYVSSVFQPSEKVYGNQLWSRSMNQNIFKEEAYDKNVSSCGWSWGAQFIDLNNDSWDDLVVTNGMFGDGTKKSLWYPLAVLDSAGRKFMGDYRNWPDMNNYDLDGGQQDCIYINTGKNGAFYKIQDSFGFDKDKKNGRAVAYIDINNDGKYTLLVANQNDYSEAYDVVPNSPFNWIGLDLKGFNNNSFAIGAKVIWQLSDGSESFKEMRPIQGFASQNDPRFRLAFPLTLHLTKLSIKWLDNSTTLLDLNKLKMNKYNIIIKN